MGKMGHLNGSLGVVVDHEDGRTPGHGPGTLARPGMW
jgi:hypothetical protein